MELLKKYTDYSEMVRDAVLNGTPKCSTHSLGFTHFSIKLGKELQGKLVYPTTRLGLKTYLSYVLAEAAWYMAKSRTVEFIGKYGPIWYKMVDENGLVNSNYGYQISKNNDLKNTILIPGKTYTFNIASKDNYLCMSDTVCNNMITLKVKEGYAIDIESTARSIDLLYGFPMDNITLQAFVYWLLDKQGSVGYIDNLSFKMIDAHVYTNMFDKLDLNATSGWSAINYNDTPYKHVDLDNYTNIDYKEYAKEIHKEEVVVYPGEFPELTKHKVFTTINYERFMKDTESRKIFTTLYTGDDKNNRLYGLNYYTNIAGNNYKIKITSTEFDL